MSHLSNVWFKVTDLAGGVRTGCRVTTIDGEEYLDFAAGIAVNSTGHCHPQVTRGDRRAGTAVHPRAGQRVHARPARAAGCQARRVVARRSIDTFFYANSGAEITEAAVKLAKQVTKRPQHDRVQRQLPRAHTHGDGDDDVEDGVSRRSLPTALPASSWHRSRIRWHPTRMRRSPMR